MTLGSLTGVALHRQILLDEHVEKLRLDRELEVARAIQRSLLPTTDPQIEGFDIAGWSQPTEAIGGDFYDYISFPDGRLGVVLADVTGHGLGSSLLACESRAFIRSAAAATGSLDAIAALANELLYADLKHHRFVTMFLGCIEPSTSTIEYIGAGHTALMWRPTGGGTCELLMATNPPLAVLPKFELGRAVTLQLEPGAILALITDGFWEWENPGEEQFGFERLFAIIKRHHSESSTAIIAALHEGVMAFANGTRQVDDLTAVVIKRV